MLRAALRACPPHVVKYLNELRASGVGPSGQITKLQTILNTIKMLVVAVPDDGGNEETRDLVVRAKVMETKIRGISKSLRKECSVIRLQKRDMFDGGSGLRDNVLKFLDDPRLLEVVSSYLKKPEMEEGESLIARHYLMCSLMFKNAQRQGAVVNLRIAEVERAVRHETQSGSIIYVYKVCHATCTDCIFERNTTHHMLAVWKELWNSMPQSSKVSATVNTLLQE